MRYLWMELTGAIIQNRVFVVLFYTALFCTGTGFAQNVGISLQSDQNGLVRKNETIELRLLLTNTSSQRVPEYKLRPLVSLPSTVKFEGAVLPDGWTVVSSTGGNIRFCNGTDIIPRTTARMIIITLRGLVPGERKIIQANLGFGNEKPGCLVGGQTTGNNPVDDVSSAFIEVNRP